MSDQQEGRGWWQASDGKWYPPEAAPAAPPTETTQTWAPPGPGMPPSGPNEPAKSKLPLALGAAALLLVLLVGAFFLLKDDDDDEETSSSDTTEGFEVLEGEGVSIAAPEGWQVIGSEDFDMSSDELAEAFPDAPEGMIDQGLALFNQGAVLVAFDAAGEEFSSNVNVIDIPGEVPLDQLESQAVSQLEVAGGEVSDSGTVDVALGEALRIVYTLDVSLPDGSTIPAQGVQYYLPVDGHTYIVTVSTGEGAEELGSQMIDTFTVG